MTAKVKAIISTIIATILIVLMAIGFAMSPEILGIFLICVGTIILLGVFPWMVYCKMIEFFKD